MATSHNIVLPKVILSYPNLYRHEMYQGKPTDNPQYSATFLFDDQELHDRLWEIGMETAEEAFGAKKIPKNFKTSERVSIKEVKLSTEDGDSIDFEGWSIKALSKKRPTTIARDKTPVDSTDGDEDGNGIFYPGCMVDGQVSLWTTPGYPHLRANLLLVRFRSDGERLGGTGGPRAADLIDELDDLGDAEDDL